MLESLMGRFRGAKQGGLALGVQFDGERVALAGLSAGPGAPRLLAAALVEESQGEEAVQARLRSAGLRRAPVTLCLAPGEYELVNMERPPVPEEELVEAVRWKVGDLLPWPVEEAVIDVFVIPGLDRHARAADWVFVVAARRHLIEDRLQRAEALGLRPRFVDIPEFALRNLDARLGNPQQSVAHLLVREQDSLLCVTRGDVLFFSRDIMHGAQDLAVPTQGELALANDAGEAIVLEVQRSLDYFDSHFGQPPVARLLVSPPGERLDGLRNALATGLGLAVEALDSQALAEDADARLLQAGLLDEPAMILALGAAMRGLPVAAEEAA
ncbi:MAG: hypothetical protein D6717_11425 [Gammaproteobacteria bacterium]|nr:MAG: hypothetical protein D6717_11425 [Gammaproteobacteria bacterium]